MNLSTLQSRFAHAPYLARLLARHADLYDSYITHGPDKTLATLLAALPAPSLMPAENGQADFMRALRIQKNRLALLTAIADLTGAWSLDEVTRALSVFAENSIAAALDGLLLAAHARGDYAPARLESPSQHSGIIVIGMGKLGAYELNYSSDIDLMIFFERDTLPYRGRHHPQHFMNKLAHDLAHVLEERTDSGYVFRTDLRLRPDPASMPPAISTDAAYYYYESVGQNWERAAMIKARPVAGDIPAAQTFLSNLSPFLWRRNLDYAAIQDIHSIKRQMDSRRGADIQLAGHHVKLGVGGIREIEFFVQIHQLIWGGRQPGLRLRGTRETLSQLAHYKLINTKIAEQLDQSYVFLRTLEHRLQMIHDEQTHEIPKQPAEIENLASFMGYPDIARLERDVLLYCRQTHEIYADAFQTSKQLGEAGNLVFTGVTHDPDTLATLRSMGYASPETVSETVMSWHHGAKRATRTKRARELLTELMPALLKRLAETANPDQALLRFNDFLTNLPAGVQLFSLFQAHPSLLGLIADIMGSAPMLATHLSKTPSLLDSVLYADFYDPLPNTEALLAQWKDAASLSQDFDDAMNALRRWRNEKQFQAGVHLLKHRVSARTTGAFLADLAALAIVQTLETVTEEFERTHGRVDGGAFAVIALGKLGSREMTFHSDVDLVFVYDTPDEDAISSGTKELGASVYYNRLAQRLVNTLATMEREGRLYEVDTRLRPSGTQGLLAVSLSGLKRYFDESAWTFEFMAFTKARPIAGSETLQAALGAFIHDQIGKPRDTDKLRLDVIDMRARIAKGHDTPNPWAIKYVRGGLMDIDFLAQYLLLRHAPGAPEDEYPKSAADIFSYLARREFMQETHATALIHADMFLGLIFNMLRLCAGSDADIAAMPDGVKTLLCESANQPDFETLERQLIAIEQSVFTRYNQDLNSERMTP